MSRQKVFVNWALVYLLLFLSGSWRFNLASDRYLILGFLASLTAWILFTDRKISDRFLLYLITFAGFLFSLSLYTHGSLSLPSVIASTMKLSIAFCIVKTVGAKFTDVYIKLMVFLAAISMFGYLTDRLDLFDSLVRRLSPVGEMGYEGFFYLYRFQWHIDRNNSIFFEPGAYQAFLNTGLFLLFFTETSFERSKKRVYIAILTIALITTFSTTGFLIFAVMLVVFLYKSKLATFSEKIVILGLMLVAIIVFSAQFYATFMGKLQQYLATDQIQLGSSAMARSSSRIADLRILKKHIFGLGHDEYIKEFTDLLGSDGASIGSTDGVTRTFAVFGLPFGLFLFGSWFWAFKRLLGEYLLASIAFCLFLLFLTGEAYYIATPATYAFIAAAFLYDRGSAKKQLKQQTGPLPDSSGRPLQ